jgi:hypothetical protein
VELLTLLMPWVFVKKTYGLHTFTLGVFSEVQKKLLEAFLKVSGGVEYIIVVWYLITPCFECNTNQCQCLCKWLALLLLITSFFEYILHIMYENHVKLILTMR